MKARGSRPDPVELIEIRCGVPFDAAERVHDLLLEREDARWSVLQDVIARTAWVAGIFANKDDAASAWTALRPHLPATGDATVRVLADADWRDSYKEHFKPWRCGRLHWVPVWEKDGYRLPAGEVALWLDPGLAFGTGNHETTRLCGERLVARAAGPSGFRVIDAGCGSGILALSAARLGARDVYGFDLDPEAIRVSRENANLNGLKEACFATADLESGLEGRQAELLLANIQADVLVAHAPALVAAVAPGGMLVLSGILACERDEVRRTFETAAPGWTPDSRVLGEWCDVALDDRR